MHLASAEHHTVGLGKENHYFFLFICFVFFLFFRNLKLRGEDKAEKSYNKTVAAKLVGVLAVFQTLSQALFEYTLSVLFRAL